MKNKTISWLSSLCFPLLTAFKGIKTDTLYKSNSLLSSSFEDTGNLKSFSFMLYVNVWKNPIFCRLWNVATVKHLSWIINVIVPLTDAVIDVLEFPMIFAYFIVVWSHTISKPITTSRSRGCIREQMNLNTIPMPCSFIWSSWRPNMIMARH